MVGIITHSLNLWGALLPFGPDGHSNVYTLPGTILWTKTGSSPTVVSVATVDGASVLLTLDTEAPVLVGQRHLGYPPDVAGFRGGGKVVRHTRSRSLNIPSPHFLPRWDAKGICLKERFQRDGMVLSKIFLCSPRSLGKIMTRLQLLWKFYITCLFYIVFYVFPPKKMNRCIDCIDSIDGWLGVGASIYLENTG